MDEMAGSSESSFETRLRRLDRVFIRNPIYFLTLCTEDRARTIANPAIHDAFIRFCRFGVERGAFVGNYVIMPDHLHLFIRFAEAESAVAAVCDRRLDTPRGPNHPLSLWVKSLKNSLSKRLRELKVPSPHWQKGFFDHALRSAESYSDKWGYVTENPVRAGLVSHAENWPYKGEIGVLAGDLD